MEGEDRPILIVDETRLDFGLNILGLAAELIAVVRDFHGLAVFVLPLVGDLAGLGFPRPGAGKFKYAGDFAAPCVADRLNPAPRINAIRFCNLLSDGRRRLGPRVCSNEKHCKNQNMDDLCTVSVFHKWLLEETEGIRQR